ncbi:putative Spectrin beta chain-like 2, partial [Homarus americanus]
MHTAEEMFIYIILWSAVEPPSAVPPSKGQPHTLPREHDESAAVRGGSAPSTPRPPSTPATPTPASSAVRWRPVSATLPPQSSMSPISS